MLAVKELNDQTFNSLLHPCSLHLPLSYQHRVAADSHLEKTAVAKTQISLALHAY